MGDNRYVCYSAAIAFFLLINGILLYSIVGTYSKSIIAFAGVLILLWIIVCLSVLQLRKKSLRVHHVFLIAMLTLGVTYSAVFPPMTVPDETYHFEHSYMYSDYLMLKGPSPAELPIREDDKALIDHASSRLSYPLYVTVINNFEVFSSNPYETALTPGVAVNGNLPQLKIPSAIGITIARILGLGSYPLFYLGRFFNFLYFLVLVYFAVKIIPIGKNLLMAIALLPMTLHVASSYSYDAGILGLSFFLIALCMKAIYCSDRLKQRDFIAIIASALLLAPCKVVYSLLIFLILLIPNKAFASKRSAILFKVGVPLMALGLISLLWITTILKLFGFGSTANGNLDLRGTEVGHFHSISEFLIDPIGTIGIFVRSLNVYGDFYLSSTVGGSLGWFQSELAAPWFAIFVFILFIGLSIIKTPDDNVTIPIKHKIFFIATTVLGLFVIMISMFIGFTFQQETSVLGVQGRYLLPFLPIGLLAFRSNTISSNRNIQKMIIFGMLVMNFAYLNRIYAIATTLTLK